MNSRPRPGRHTPRDLLPAIAMLVGACLDHAFEPPNARPLASQPSSYAVWWQGMEACAHVSAPLSQVEWYEVPGGGFATPDGPRWGWWDPPHTIYLAAAHVNDERLVEHEMLHDLLQTGAHPAPFQACGVGVSAAEASD